MCVWPLWTVPLQALHKATGVWLTGAWPKHEALGSVHGTKKKKKGLCTQITPLGCYQKKRGGVGERWVTDRLLRKRICAEVGCTEREGWAGCGVPPSLLGTD